MKFDKYQQKVLESNFPIICIAGPGSGKTTIMIEKILKTATLENIDKLLILTFTNNAANEIKKRLNKKFNVKRNYNYIGTFHSVFFRLLKENKKYLKKINNFNVDKLNIIEPDDDYKLFEITFESTNTLLKKNENETKKNYKKRIESILGLGIKDIYKILTKITRQTSIIDFDELEIKFLDIYKKLRLVETLKYSFDLSYIIKSYIARKANWGMLNFDDILNYFNIMLNNNHELQQKLEEQFDYIFVDEMQDTNKLQVSILEKLFNDNFFMIGDPYQSIYKFLGSDIKNFIKYIKEKSNNTNFLQLVYNYRSTETIVDLINKYTINFKDKKELLKNEYKSIRKDKGKIEVIEYDVKNVVFEKILVNEVKQSKNIEDIAVIARSNYELVKIELILKQNNIPYKKLSGKSIYEIPEIKYINDLIKFWIDKNPLSFLNILSNIEYIGPKSMEKITNIHMNLINILDFNDEKTLDKAKEIINQLQIPKKAKNNLIKTLSYFYIPVNFNNLLNIIINTKYIEKRLEEIDSLIKREERKNLINKYLNEIKDYLKNRKDFNDFINDILLKNFKKENEEKGISLTTIHGAKGLEWSSVFVINVDDINLPKLAKYNPDIEEEKRLLYVAISRAKDNLYLFSNQSISKYIKNII